jgi:hypothetical protein
VVVLAEQQMSLREDLVALGLPIPEEIPVDRWASALADVPCKNTLTLVGLSTVLFYAAEKNHNSRVNDIWDALVYCSTCISVGYADIFPRTPIGKILGSALMTIGPSMAARMLDGAKIDNRDETQQQILRTLRQILDALHDDSSDAHKEAK